MQYIKATIDSTPVSDLKTSENHYILSCHINEYRKIRKNVVAQAVLCYWLQQEFARWYMALQAAIDNPTSTTVDHLCDCYRALKREYDNVVKQKSPL